MREILINEFKVVMFYKKMEMGYHVWKIEQYKFNRLIKSDEEFKSFYSDAVKAAHQYIYG